MRVSLRLKHLKVGQEEAAAAGKEEGAFRFLAPVEAVAKNAAYFSAQNAKARSHCWRH